MTIYRGPYSRYRYRYRRPYSRYRRPYYQPYGRPRVRFCGCCLPIPLSLGAAGVAGVAGLLRRRHTPSAARWG